MKKMSASIIVISLFFLAGCYRDKVAELHPKTAAGCDTTNVTYSKTIVPIMNAYCVSCHGGNTPKAGIALDRYDGFADVISNWSLIGSIIFDPAYSKMPEGATEKMDSCYIKQIEIWVNAGAPNN